ncbi:MAG: NADH-quinone oxidoreductase subunit N, partial [Singulisphaera sp.]|nr:NADH-quinone oxidoreductase subunit N [Singulisphaera sp.]
GMPPLAGFFGKLYMFMEALDESQAHSSRLTLMWLVGLGLINSVVSAFYYVRVLKAMFLRHPGRAVLAPAGSSLAVPIVLATAVVIGFGLYPTPLLNLMKAAAVPMIEESGRTLAEGQPASKGEPDREIAPGTPKPGPAAEPSREGPSSHPSPAPVPAPNS